MKSLFKNITLLVIVVVLSYFTASSFGLLYIKFSPQYDNTLGLGEQANQFIMGTPFAYIFFTVLIFQLFGVDNRNKWNIWLLAPALLFFGSGDIQHIYLPILLGLVAYALAWGIRKVFRIGVQEQNVKAF